MIQTLELDWPLEKLEAWMLRVTTESDSPRADKAAQLDLDSDSVAQAHLLRPAGIESPFERLAIYRRGYFARLTECLADDFPALMSALGGPQFKTLCKDYIATHPSTSPNLNSFGRFLPDFLLQHNDLEMALFYRDLARLEWALVEVLHAEASPPISAMALAATLTESLLDIRVEVSKAVKLLTFGYPVNEFFQAFCDNSALELPAPTITSVAVVRVEYALWRLDLLPVQATLLSRLAQGKALNAALDGIQATPAQIQAWFSDWTRLGIFSAISLTNTCNDGRPTTY